MAIDRSAVRQRVKRLTAWAGAGGAALTAAFAVGAARGPHAAHANSATQPSTSAPAPAPQSQDYGTPSPDQGAYGFLPPSASTAPPQAMSGGS